MPRTEPTRQACIQALWRRNRGAALFLIGPALGLWLVDAIFAFPPPLWLGAIGVALIMGGLFGYLLWRDFLLLCRQSRRDAGQNI